MRVRLRGALGGGARRQRPGQRRPRRGFPLLLLRGDLAQELRRLRDASRLHLHRCLETLRALAALPRAALELRLLSADLLLALRLRLRRRRARHRPPTPGLRPRTNQFGDARGETWGTYA